MSSLKKHNSSLLFEKMKEKTIAVRYDVLISLVNTIITHVKWNVELITSFHVICQELKAVQLELEKLDASLQLLTAKAEDSSILEGRIASLKAKSFSVRYEILKGIETLSPFQKAKVEEFHQEDKATVLDLCGEVLNLFVEKKEAKGIRIQQMSQDSFTDPPPSKKRKRDMDSDDEEKEEKEDVKGGILSSAIATVSSFIRSDDTEK